MQIDSQHILPALALIVAISSGVFAWVGSDAVSAEKITTLENKVKVVDQLSVDVNTLKAKQDTNISYSISHGNKLKELSAAQQGLVVDNKLVQRQLEVTNAYIKANESWKNDTELRIRHTEQSNVLNTQVLKELTHAVTNLSANTQKQTDFFTQVAVNDQRIKNLEEHKTDKEEK